MTVDRWWHEFAALIARDIKQDPEFRALVTQVIQELQLAHKAALAKEPK